MTIYMDSREPADMIKAVGAKIIAFEDCYNYVEVSPDCTPPKLLTQLNADVQWCECPSCLSKRIYSIQYLPHHYGYYCTECKLAYIAERIK